jgi:AcrR family transcriptional regulator
MDGRRKRATARLPTQRRAHATLDAILDATVQILVTRGSEGVTVQGIARRAGVSVGSLYQYFTTKDALVDACSERTMRRSHGRLESQLPRLFALPIQEAAPIIVEGLVANWLADEALLRALLARGRPLEGVTELQDRAVDLIHTYLEPRARERGETRARTAAFVLVHTVHSVIEAAFRKQPEELRSGRLTSELTRLVAAYLSPWHGAAQ